jgi:hypothetical protein
MAEVALREMRLPSLLDFDLLDEPRGDAFPERGVVHSLFDQSVLTGAVAGDSLRLGDDLPDACEYIVGTRVRARRRLDVVLEAFSDLAEHALRKLCLLLCQLEVRFLHGP